MIRLAVFALLLTSALSPAADLAAIDRTIAREPAYASRAPRYALIVLGPGAKDRVWLAKDGDILHVDRNGNGDLTDPGEKISPREGGSAENGYIFEVPDLTLGGRKHLNLQLAFRPFRQALFGENSPFRSRRPCRTSTPLRGSYSSPAPSTSAGLCARRLRRKRPLWFTSAGRWRSHFTSTDRPYGATGPTS
jgi:hypothetical protein